MIFDNKIINLFKQMIIKDGFIELPSEGCSMFPFIRKGDICRFVSFNTNKLAKGDIVLFHSELGQLIAHRYSHSVQIQNVIHYYFKGDTNFGFDKPVKESQMIGKLVCIRRADSEINIENILFKGLGKLVLTVPAFSGILRRYLNLRSLLHY